MRSQWSEVPWPANLTSNTADVLPNQTINVM